MPMKMEIIGLTEANDDHKRISHCPANTGIICLRGNRELIPIISIVGHSKTGKTTYIRKLVKNCD